jgi:hypothetical protein
MKKLVLMLALLTGALNANAELPDPLKKLNDAVNILKKGRKENAAQNQAAPQPNEGQNQAGTQNKTPNNEVKNQQENSQAEPTQVKKADASSEQTGKAAQEAPGRQPIVMAAYKTYSRTMASTKNLCEKNVSAYYQNLAKKMRARTAQANTKDEEKALILQAEIWDNANTAYARIGCFVKLFIEVEAQVRGTFFAGSEEAFWKTISDEQLTSNALKKIEARMLVDHEKWAETTGLSQPVKNSLFQTFHRQTEEHFMYDIKNENIFGCAMQDLSEGKKKITCPFN